MFDATRIMPHVTIEKLNPTIYLDPYIMWHDELRNHYDPEFKEWLHIPAEYKVSIAQAQLLGKTRFCEVHKKREIYYKEIRKSGFSLRYMLERKMLYEKEKVHNNPTFSLTSLGKAALSAHIFKFKYHLTIRKAADSENERYHYENDYA
jgi:hypothetical protein